MLKTITIILITLGHFFYNPNGSNVLYSEVKSPGIIQFIANAGSDNVFTIERWKFTQLENLDSPESMIIKAEMDINSISCNWSELNTNVKEKRDYFHVKKFPKAHVQIEGAIKNSDGTYTTKALLTLKGVSGPVELNFSMTDTAPYAIEANGIIIRQDFKFKDKGPKNEVPLSISAILTMD